jgi:hypothetical protein
MLQLCEQNCKSFHVHSHPCRAATKTALTYCMCKKVKCTLIQALRLCTGCMAHRERRGIALPFLDQSTRRGWGVSIMLRLLFTPRKDPTHCTRGWVGPRADVDRCGKSRPPTGFRSSDRPVHSQLVYRLCYPAHTVCMKLQILIREGIPQQTDSTVQDTDYDLVMLMSRLTDWP